MKRFVFPAVLAGLLAGAAGCGDSGNKAVAPPDGASKDIGKPKIEAGGTSGIKEGAKGVTKNPGAAAE